jgi:hypothetical protein
MLTQISKIKALLAITDTLSDDLLTSILIGVSARFDKECHRILSRTVGWTQEFPADQTQVLAQCYPIETVTRFELKNSEAEGWVEQPDTGFLVRSGCVISLENELGAASQQARVTYTGGYVLPGTTAAPGQTPLPDDLEQAAIQQTAFWFQNRDCLGVAREWPKGGLYKQFLDIDLLPSVRVTLRQHQRMAW